MSGAAGSWPGAFPEPAGHLVEELLDLARRVALAAGDLIRAAGAAAPAVEATKSSPTDVVTAMDRAVEEFLRGELRAARAADGLLGEEAGDVAGRSGLTWVLDPIDGTVNYLYRRTEFGVSVAVVQGDPRQPGGWRPIAGCVHAPATGRTWTAGRGRGARCEDASGARELPRLGAGPALGQALVGTGFGYRAGRRRAQAAVLAELIGRIRDVRRAGSAALDLCAVASGELDAFYERGLNVWDMAAAALVVTEAGGVVRGLGGPPSESMVLAAPAELAERLAGALAEAGAERDDLAD